jgi:hypothetical protein
MAVHKATRSNPLAQPKPKPTRRRPNPQPHHSQTKDPQAQDLQMKDPHLKSQLLETLRHLNRGFGVALGAFDRLQRQDRLHKPGIFPYDCLHGYRNRTEELRALANRDLLRLFAGREDQDAERFGRLLKRWGETQ